MTGMSLPQGTRLGAAAGYLGMWMAMMLPMMSPSLIPMLARYRRSLCGAVGIQRQGLTALVATGYFAVWGLIGVVAWAAGAGIETLRTRWVGAGYWSPVAAGVVLLLAGGVQFTRWKARQLAHCRGISGCGPCSAPGPHAAWRHGVGLGLRCSLCCGSLMLALLAVGMMNLAAMLLVTIAISAERLAPAPLRMARAAGVAMAVTGVLMIARA